MPKSHSFKHFHTWTKQYGPIFRLLAGKDTIIVLGDQATAHELLNKRSANYSDRPRLPMASELLYNGDHSKWFTTPLQAPVFHVLGVPEGIDLGR